MTDEEMKNIFGISIEKTKGRMDGYVHTFTPKFDSKIKDSTKMIILGVVQLITAIPFHGTPLMPIYGLLSIEWILIGLIVTFHERD